MNFLIKSNLFVSLCASSLAWESYILHNSEVDYLIIFLVFISTLFVYNFHRYIKSRKQKLSVNEEAIKNGQFYKLLSVTSFIAILITWVFLSNFEKNFFAAVGFLTILYSVGFFKIKGEVINLRKVPYFKLFWISMMWTIITVSFPLLNEQFSGNYWLLFSERFVFIMAITIPFDIRDLDADIKEGLKTIPIAFGFKKSVKLAIALLVVFGLMTVYGFRINMHTDIQTLALMFSFGFSTFLISGVSRERHELFYTLGVEGLSLLQALFVLAFMLIHY